MEHYGTLLEHCGTLQTRANKFISDSLTSHEALRSTKHWFQCYSLLLRVSFR